MRINGQQTLTFAVVVENRQHYLVMDCAVVVIVLYMIRRKRFEVMIWPDD